jgi:hypothetical protein
MPVNFSPSVTRGAKHRPPLHGERAKHHHYPSSPLLFDGSGRVAEIRGLKTPVIAKASEELTHMLEDERRLAPID